jgi:hypothetical protein
MRVDFYHLQSSPLERALPLLVTLLERRQSPRLPGAAARSAGER